MMWLESLKRMKTASGLTTSEISKGSGIPEPTLEKLFAGSTKTPQLGTMQKLVYFLGYTLEDLFPTNDSCLNNDVSTQKKWISNLIQLKKKSGKTTKQISEESGVPLGTLNKLFAGQTQEPKFETIWAVVKALGFTLDDLDEIKKSPTSSNDDAGEKVDPEKLYEALIQLGFLKDGEDLSDSDLRFLISVGEILRAWFAERK